VDRHFFDADPDPVPTFHFVTGDQDPIRILPKGEKSEKIFTCFTFFVSVVTVTGIIFNILDSTLLAVC
jgi:hypothetical protein